MQRAKFFEAAGQLLNWQSSLSIATDNALRFAEDMLCGKLESVPGLPPLPSILLVELKAIGDRIEEVMYAYDSLCDAAGGVPRFELALLLLDASPRVQSDVALRRSVPLSKPCTRKSASPAVCWRTSCRTAG